MLSYSKMIIEGLYGTRLHYAIGDIEFHLGVCDGKTCTYIFLNVSSTTENGFAYSCVENFNCI